MPVPWIRCEISFPYLLPLESRGKSLSTLSEEDCKKRIILIFKNSVMEVFTKTVLQIMPCAMCSHHKGEASLPFRTSVWLGTSLGWIRSMEKAFRKWVLSTGVTIAFSKVAGTWLGLEVSDSIIKSWGRGPLRAEEWLVCNCSRREFPGGQKKGNEVRWEARNQAAKDIRQLFFKHVNHDAHTALEKSENYVSTDLKNYLNKYIVYGG